MSLNYNLIKMYKIIKYIVAYFCLFILNCLFVLILLNIFGFINLSRPESMYLTYIGGAIFGFIYHKLKPMDLKDVVSSLMNYIKGKFKK